MQTTIDTIRGVIFEKKERLKRLNNEFDGVIRILCDKKQSIEQLSANISILEIELNRVCNSQFPGLADRPVINICDNDKNLKPAQTSEKFFHEQKNAFDGPIKY